MEEDITQQNCPKGGKHKLVYLKNAYSIACEKCRQIWTRHPKDILGEDYNPNNFSSSKSEIDG